MNDQVGDAVPTLRITRACRRCREMFTIEIAEERLLRGQAREPWRAARELWRGFGIPARCPPCQRARRQGADDVTLVCAACGGPVRLEVRHVEWFAKRGWRLPSRCLACRQRAAAAAS